MEFKEFKKHMDRLKQQSDNSFALYKAFGCEGKDGSVVDEEGNTINIRTVEDLYNRLTEWGKEG
jgi:hypothetical protein